MEAQNNVRKRVFTACDRCRLKKSKCDGTSLCSRCKADNSICVYGHRRKTANRLYPEGYATVLEQQQAQLVAGLRELYSRLQNGECWSGQPLHEAQDGHPRTHDILEHLNLLHPSNDNSGYEPFEDDCDQIRHKLLKGGAPFARANGYAAPASDHVHTPTSSPHGYQATSTSRSDLFARNNLPPMSHMDSPVSRQSPVVFPATQEPHTLSSTWSSTGVSGPPSFFEPTFPNDSVMMDELLDLSRPTYGFEIHTCYDQSITLVDPVVMNPDDSRMWNDTRAWDSCNPV